MPVTSPRQRPRTTAAYRTPGSSAARRAQRPQRGIRRPGDRRPVAGGRSVLLGVISIASFALFFGVFAIAAGQMMQSVQNQDVGRFAGAAGASVLAFVFPFIGLLTGGIGCFLRTQNRVLAGIGAALNGILVVWIIVSLVNGSRALARARAESAVIPGYNATTASISTRPPLGSAATCTVARAG